MHQTNFGRRAFTLVELLVVIGIIAILLALLLPALVGMRRYAQSVACQANLRSAGQAMLIYVADNKGWIPGSPSTTGRQLWKASPSDTYQSAGFSANNVPGPVIELFDYMGPLSAIMNVPISATNSGVERLRTYRTLQVFTCPTNRGEIARRNGGASMEDGQMLSYCTPTAFMLLPARIATIGNTDYAGRVTMPTGGSATDPAKFNFWSSPPSYFPKITKVGPPSRKIFLADSGRRSRYNKAPEFIYAVESDYVDTLFSDFGPFYGITRSYDRSMINGGSGPFDGRVFAYRHGTRGQGKTSGLYRMNAVFFDGHTESLDDMESARPEYWLPTGSVIYHNTKLNATDMVFWPDVWAKYLEGQPLPYRVP